MPSQRIQNMIYLWWHGSSIWLSMILLYWNMRPLTLRKRSRPSGYQAKTEFLLTWGQLTTGYESNGTLWESKTKRLLKFKHQGKHRYKYTLESQRWGPRYRYRSTESGSEWKTNQWNRGTGYETGVRPTLLVTWLHHLIKARQPSKVQSPVCSSTRRPLAAVLWEIFCLPLIVWLSSLLCPQSQVSLLSEYQPFPFFKSAMILETK